MKAFRLLLAIVALVAAMGLGALSATAAEPDVPPSVEVLRDWYKLALALVRHTPTYSPPVAARTFAYLGVDRLRGDGERRRQIAVAGGSVERPQAHAATRRGRDLRRGRRFSTPRWRPSSGTCSATPARPGRGRWPRSRTSCMRRFRRLCRSRWRRAARLTAARSRSTSWRGRTTTAGRSSRTWAFRWSTR